MIFLLQLVGVHFLLSSLPKVQYYYRQFLYAVCVLLTTIPSLVIGVVLVMFGQRYSINKLSGDILYYLCRALVGISIRVVDEEKMPKGPAIYVINHQSWLDFCIASRIAPPRVVCVAKKEIQYYPVLGQLRTSFLSNLSYAGQQYSPQPSEPRKSHRIPAACG